MHTAGTSVRQTAAHFNIPSHVTVSKWERIYYEEKMPCTKNVEKRRLKWE